MVFTKNFIFKTVSIVSLLTLLVTFAKPKVSTADISRTFQLTLGLGLPIILHTNVASAPSMRRKSFIAWIICGAESGAIESGTSESYSDVSVSLAKRTLPSR